jgi:hypothetical protein
MMTYSAKRQAPGKVNAVIETQRVLAVDVAAHDRRPLRGRPHPDDLLVVLDRELLELEGQ